MRRCSKSVSYLYVSQKPKKVSAASKIFIGCVCNVSKLGYGCGFIVGLVCLRVDVQQFGLSSRRALKIKGFVETAEEVYEFGDFFGQAGVELQALAAARVIEA